MHQEQFPIPEYPKLAFKGVSFQSLNQQAPNYANTARWYARLIISAAFMLFAVITTVSCLYFGLTTDIFFLATLVGTLLVYMISMPVLTKAFVTSERIKNKMKVKKRRFYLRSLANTPINDRLDVANSIWEALRSEEWSLCITYAHAADRTRTVYCCQQIGKIASELTHTAPDVYTDAMLKTMNNQRGSVRYFFDILSMLGEQQFHEEHEAEKHVRTTQRIMVDDIFTHR
ncbi:hypothetical protein GCE9029_00577 [Grimontia celer]|uniref:Uncharacterized protein n=1 Tax=Grimontia celer TaxID=1796497 RepID=A0A128ETY7_9GAMM|nr:hypothetical protein [Grimontia celer]CZF78042.1 hypothetical protein GCE9029_00577 [Grimontia celer]